MKILHLVGSESRGGAAQAAKGVRELVGGHYHMGAHTRRHSKLAYAWRVIAGLMDPFERRSLKGLVKGYDLIHLHNFKEAGTAAIAAARAEGVPVIWSCYDYWALCPRDNFYSPAGICDWATQERPCLQCYQPRGREKLDEKSAGWLPGLPSSTRRPPPRGRWSWIFNLALLGRRRRLVKWLNRLDAIICLSWHSKGVLRADGVTVPISVIPGPVDVEADDDSPWRLGDYRHLRRVLFLGWRRPNKGSELFYDIRRLVHERCPDADVMWLQVDEHDDALRAIQQAAVLVVPEQWPNMMPLVIVEAALLGTPVVAPDRGGISEFLPFLVPLPDTPEAYADRIVRLIVHGDVAQDRGDAHREWARIKFNRDTIKAKINKVYRCAAC